MSVEVELIIICQNRSKSADGRTDETCTISNIKEYVSTYLDGGHGGVLQVLEVVVVGRRLQLADPALLREGSMDHWLLLLLLLVGLRGSVQRGSVLARGALGRDAWGDMM